MKEIKKTLDTDGDGKISQKEVENAIKLLKKAKKEKEEKVRLESFSKFKSLVNI